MGRDPLPNEHIWQPKWTAAFTRSSPIKLQKIVSLNGKEGWSFAAPGEIHGAIVDLLPAAARDRIVEHVKSDLVKVEPAKLVSRFRSLQQI